MDREPAVLARLGTLVRDTQKVKRFRPTLAAALPTFDRLATELDQTRFSFV